MNTFMMGGWIMWPLAGISVTCLAIIIERILLFSACPFPRKKFALSLESAAEGNFDPAFAELNRIKMLQHFATIMHSSSAYKENTLRIAGATIVQKLEKHLALLSILARIAPLMGLLGTVLGMISTFAEIANSQAGINMNQLAGGIWQALITTATGLCIAIPALLCLHFFQNRIDSVAAALADLANLVLVYDHAEQKK